MRKKYNDINKKLKTFTETWLRLFSILYKKLIYLLHQFPSSITDFLLDKAYKLENILLFDE